ncbi:S-adenosyl-L-methionine-dependent methyltransferases superfamily protein [Tanacetum coccineum]
MQHQVDGRAWKKFDIRYPKFAAKPRNVRLGLAADGFNPFGNLNMARRPLGWKVVEHVSHKKFSNGGVIVVEDDPDVIHVDNSSDLALSSSLNDLDFATLHIDGQSTDVDAPPDIIDVDEDNDIIDDEDTLPYDLAYSDDEDLVNVDDDDDVAVVYSSKEED